MGVYKTYKECRNWRYSEGLEEMIKIKKQISDCDIICKNVSSKCGYAFGK